MRSLEEPEAPRGHGLLWILLVLAMLGGAAAWYATTRLATPASPAAPPRGASERATPSSANEPSGTTERKEPTRGGFGSRPTPSRPTGTERAARVPATPARASRDF